MPIADMEACYARCNCWTDFPDMGGQVTRGGSNGLVVSVSVRWSGGPPGGQVVRRTGWLFGPQVATGQVICTITLYTILCRSPMRLTPGASRTHVGATIIRY